MGVFKNDEGAEDRKEFLVAAMLLSAAATILSFVPYDFQKCAYGTTGDADYLRITSCQSDIWNDNYIHTTYIAAPM